MWKEPWAAREAPGLAFGAPVVAFPHTSFAFVAFAVEGGGK